MQICPNEERTDIDKILQVEPVGNDYNIRFAPNDKLAKISSSLLSFMEDSKLVDSLGGKADGKIPLIFLDEVSKQLAPPKSQDEESEMHIKDPDINLSRKAQYLRGKYLGISPERSDGFETFLGVGLRNKP